LILQGKDMKHSVLNEKIYLTKMFLSILIRLIKPYLEYEERAAEFKKAAAHYHLKPEVEAALIAKARRRAVSTPFNFYDLLLDEIQQLRNKGFL